MVESQAAPRPVLFSRTDNVYATQNGDGRIMTFSPRSSSYQAGGNLATTVLSIDLSTTPAPIGISGTVT
jgi:hypothetical protein